MQPAVGPGRLPESATCSRLTAATGACLWRVHVQLELAPANAFNPLCALHQVPPAAGQHPPHLHQACRVEFMVAGLLQGLAALLAHCCSGSACIKHAAAMGVPATRHAARQEACRRGLGCMCTLILLLLMVSMPCAHLAVRTRLAAPGFLAHSAPNCSQDLIPGQSCTCDTAAMCSPGCRREGGSC